jgi:hypothetical protein
LARGLAILVSALCLTLAESVKISVTLLVENKAKLNATDNRKTRLLFPPSPPFVIPGRRESGEPGIHGWTDSAVQWIPGPRLTARPGMTT